MQYASWESTYHEKWRNVTIDQYALGNGAESNWMTRMLTQKMTGPISYEDLNLAKHILEEKILIGIIDDFQSSLERFETYFKWNIPLAEYTKEQNFQILHMKKDCQDDILNSKINVNGNSHEEYEEGDYVWELLANINRLDIELYEYALVLYNEQSIMF